MLQCLLSEHYDKHPVFILKDVKFKELKAMMDYMYRGEVNISQDQLAALLKAAESLQIKGLSESKTAGSSKTESRPQKTVSQPTAPSLDIPHASSGLTIEKNKVPRQSLTQSSVGDIPEDTASPQVSKGLSSRWAFLERTIPLYCNLNHKYDLLTLKTLLIVLFTFTGKVRKVQHQEKEKGFEEEV